MASLPEYIQPVCLPAAGQALVDGKLCTVTGWGNTQYYGESPIIVVCGVSVCTCLGVVIQWGGATPQGVGRSAGREGRGS